MDNRELIQKADLALSDLTAGSGNLTPARAQEFMRQLTKQSTLLGLCTAVPMKSPKQDINKIKFASRILKPGAESTAIAAGDRQKPTLSMVELDAKLVKGTVYLSDEVLEDNIEGNTLQQTVMDLISERCAADLEELVLQGDTASGDTYLALLNGVIKQATSHVVELGAPSGAGLTATVLRDALKAMPDEQLRDKANMKFLVSTDAELYYRDQMASRLTALGDQSMVGDAEMKYSGIPISAIPLMPGNLGGTTDRTVGLLLNPKNIHFGIWRNIRIESMRDIELGVTKIVVSMRVDVKYAEEDAVVKVINLKV
jgi:HK97 family phage major capsid protein